MILLFIGVIIFFRAERSHTISQAFIGPIFDTGDWMNSQIPGRLQLRSGMEGMSILLTMRDEF